MASSSTSAHPIIATPAAAAAIVAAVALPLKPSSSQHRNLKQAATTKKPQPVAVEDLPSTDDEDDSSDDDDVSTGNDVANVPTTTSATTADASTGTSAGTDSSPAAGAATKKPRAKRASPDSASSGDSSSTKKKSTKSSDSSSPSDAKPATKPASTITYPPKKNTAEVGGNKVFVCGSTGKSSAESTTMFQLPKFNADGSIKGYSGCFSGPIAALQWLKTKLLSTINKDEAAIEKDRAHFAYMFKRLVEVFGQEWATAAKTALKTATKTDSLPLNPALSANAATSAIPNLFVHISDITTKKVVDSAMAEATQCLNVCF